MGDIIFGKRRYYQKKLAVADFEGICSAHAMVLRAKPDVVLPEFLPFFMQSEMFFEQAMAISVGSLSPTINWSTLAKQEFPLPPLDEQRRIAEILWAVENVIEQWLLVLNMLEQLNLVVTRDLFQQGDKSSVLLKEVGEWVSGGTPSRSDSKYWNGDIPWASPKDMKVGVLYDTLEHITEMGAEAGTRLVPKNTIFIVTRGMILAHTFPVALVGTEMAFNQDIKALVTSKEFLPKYIFYWLKNEAPHILRITSESSHGTKRLATEEIFNLRVPCLSISEQADIISKLENIDSEIKQAQEHIQHSKALKSSLLKHLMMDIHSPELSL